MPLLGTEFVILHVVELDANTGRHRMSFTNQQADRLGVIVHDEEIGCIVQGSEGDFPEREECMSMAQDALPRLDLAILNAKREPQPVERPKGNRRVRMKGVSELFMSDPQTAYDRLVRAWREQGQESISEALEALCRDEWRAGYAHDAPHGGWEQADPRWVALATKLLLPNVVGLSSETAGWAYEVAHRQALFERARRFLTVPQGVEHYAAIQESAERPESVASSRAFREALTQALGDPHARLKEATMAPLSPRRRLLCEDIVTALGERRDADAISTLLALAENPADPLMLRAANALAKYDDPRVHAFFDTRLLDAEAKLLDATLRATFDRAPAKAYDRLHPHIDRRGDAFLLAVLRVLYRDYQNAGASHQGAARDWFRADARWRLLCAERARTPDDDASTEDSVETQIGNLANELVQRR